MKIEPHHYQPSAMHMGDCAICGHIQPDAIHQVAPDHVANIRAVIDRLMTAAAAYAGGNVAQCRRELTGAHVALETARAGFDRQHVERLPEAKRRPSVTPHE